MFLYNICQERKQTITQTVFSKFFSSNFHCKKKHKNSTLLIQNLKASYFLPEIYLLAMSYL